MIKTYCKSAKMDLEKTDLNLLEAYFKAMITSFRHSCKNHKDWKIEVYKEGKYTMLDMQCQAEEKDSGD